MRLALVRILLVIPFAVATAGRVAAREHLASIRGVVIDRAAAGIPGVEVRATREETREQRRVRTDGRGRFTVSLLPPGTYRVEVEQPGYGPFLARIALITNQEFPIEVQLRPGDVLQASDSPAPFSPVDRATAALNTFVDVRQLTALPLEDRSLLELALLAPGSARAPRGGLTFNGAREDFNGFLLDGVSDADPALDTLAARPPVDGIREFQILTSTYEAAFGRNAGAQLNIVTRSGTSRLTGSAYEFYGGGGLAARNYFAPSGEPAPDYSRHQFGGSVGGPIVESRTFFFADYERTRLREGVTSIATVPTMAERAGDFSHAAGRVPIDPSTGQPFHGGIVPSALQSAAGRTLAALYPLPNRGAGGGNYVSSPLRKDDVDRLDARVDNAFAGGTRLSARYSVGDRRRVEPFAGAGGIPGFGEARPQRAQNASVSLTHAPRRSLATDIRFGYTRVTANAAAADPGVANASVGLPPAASGDPGLSAVFVAGFSPLGDDPVTPWERASTTWQLSDAATWTHGTHLVKFGGEWFAERRRASRNGAVRGLLQFDDSGGSGNALANLLLGEPALTATARTSDPAIVRGQSWGVFAQDNWRPTETLTLTAGLRYEIAARPADDDGDASLDSAAAGLLRSAAGALPRDGVAADRNNVAPRAGFAWAFDNEARNLLRGGYGVYYNQDALTVFDGLAGYLPNTALDVRSPASGGTLTLASPFSGGRVRPGAVVAFQPDLQTPWMEHWNVNVQHQIGQTRSFEAGYAGSRGHDLPAVRNLSQPAAGGTRPDPQFGDVAIIESRAASRYNALQVRYQERPAHGMSILLSYTLGRSMDDASGLLNTSGRPAYPPNSLAPSTEWSRSSFDVRHRFSAAVLRPLPIGTGGALLGTMGWFSDALRNIDLEALVTLQSGRPFTVTLRPDLAPGRAGGATPGAGSSARPDMTGDASLKVPSAERWFNTAAFSLPASGGFGSSGRNTLDGPGYGNVSVALVKRMYFLQQGTLELRLEAFNVLDRANFDLPDSVFGSPTFGRILSSDSPRRIQLGIRTEF